MDFEQSCADPQAFLKERYSRELLDDQINSLGTYSEKELRESIIQDLLTATMWELQFKKKLPFNQQELIRYVRGYNRHRVIKQLEHKEIKHLIEQNGDQLRIRNDRVILQAAMDYCGVYYTGFDMPPDVIVVNREAFDVAVDQAGGFDNLVKSLAMDLQSSAESSKSIQ